VLTERTARRSRQSVASDIERVLNCRAGRLQRDVAEHAIDRGIMLGGRQRDWHRQREKRNKENEAAHT
jgi:predicted component of type VI protein secretion system